MAVPQAFTDFDIPGTTVSLWLFKKSAGAGGVASFTGRWIETDDNLDQALKEAVTQERARIVEVNEYSLLAQNNEGSALHIDTLETHAGLVVDQAAAELAAKKIADIRHIQNTDFYVVKLTSGDNVLHAVRKTDASWQSKKSRSVISVFFEDDRLGLDATPNFNVSRAIDFFVLGADLIISNKGNFESVLNYKQAHAEDFIDLQAEPDFSNIFTALDPIVAFVGTNKLHLRRVCAIRQKAHYRNAAFIANLRLHHARCGLTLAFDDDGRIVPTPETCADIIRALLDHRLLSVFSENIYDVDDATAIH